MAFSQTQDRAKRTSPSRFPSHWSRKLSDRTGGLFKKANTLFHLEQARVAVFVSSGGHFSGYLSHGPADWPEPHQLVASCNVALTTPDDLDTVSQRYASRSQSIVSTASSNAMTSGGEQDSIMQLLSTLEEEPEATTSASLPATISGANASLLDFDHDPSIKVWTSPSTPEQISKASESKVPTAPMSTETPFECRSSQPGSIYLRTSGGRNSPNHAAGNSKLKSARRHFNVSRHGNGGPDASAGSVCTSI
ncbi:hypothetical protein V2A60_003793 [Cordyceps javanica]